MAFETVKRIFRKRLAEYDEVTARMESTADEQYAGLLGGSETAGIAASRRGLRRLIGAWLRR